MLKRNLHGPTAALIVALTILSACATGQPTVVEKLDELTGVTITYGRTPIAMSPAGLFNQGTVVNYTRIGVIEVNRSGSLNYYLWLDISDGSQMAGPGAGPEEYKTIVLAADGEKIRLDVLGWTAASIGAGEPVHKKSFATSVEAYYPVSLDHIQLLSEAAIIELQTTDSASRVFVPLYGPGQINGELSEFLNVVQQ